MFVSLALLFSYVNAGAYRITYNGKGDEKNLAEYPGVEENPNNSIEKIIVTTEDIPDGIDIKNGEDCIVAYKKPITMQIFTHQRTRLYKGEVKVVMEARALGKWWEIERYTIKAGSGLDSQKVKMSDAYSWPLKGMEVGELMIEPATYTDSDDGQPAAPVVFDEPFSGQVRVVQRFNAYGSSYIHRSRTTVRMSAVDPDTGAPVDLGSFQLLNDAVKDDPVQWAKEHAEEEARKNAAKEVKKVAEDEVQVDDAEGDKSEVNGPTTVEDDVAEEQKNEGATSVKTAEDEDISEKESNKVYIFSESSDEEDRIRHPLSRSGSIRSTASTKSISKVSLDKTDN